MCWVQDASREPAGVRVPACRPERADGRRLGGGEATHRCTCFYLFTLIVQTPQDLYFVVLHLPPDCSSAYLCAQVWVEDESPGPRPAGEVDSPFAIIEAVTPKSNVSLPGHSIGCTMSAREGPPGLPCGTMHIVIRCICVPHRGPSSRCRASRR